MTGLTNAKKAVYYGQIYDRIERGWTQGQLYDSQDGACLRGAIQRVAGWREQHELDMDLARALFDRSPLMLRLKFEEPCPRAIEVWNDRSFRRKKTVLKVLREQQEKYAALAKEDRVHELEARVAELENVRIPKLQARIAELEAEVMRLRTEVSFWKARRAKVTAKDLVTSSDELARLDTELDYSMRELTRLSV